MNLKYNIMMHRILVTIFIFALSTLTANACVCSYNQKSLHSIIKNTEIVFIGTPLETKSVNPEDCRAINISHIDPGLEPMKTCSGLLVTRFQVTTLVKGDVGETFDIYHENQSSCGVSSLLNEPIYIFAVKWKGVYAISSCSLSIGHSLEAVQAYAETSLEERGCMEQMLEAYEPLIEKEALKAYMETSIKEPYSLSMLNLDPFCEAYWPTYQEKFGSLGAKVFHSIISAPVQPLSVKPETPEKKNVNGSVRPVIKYLLSLGLLSLVVLIMLFVRRRVFKG